MKLRVPARLTRGIARKRREFRRRLTGYSLEALGRCSSARAAGGRERRRKRHPSAGELVMRRVIRHLKRPFRGHGRPGAPGLSQRTIATIVVFVFILVAVVAKLLDRDGITIADAGDLATVAAALVTAITLLGISWQLRLQANLARAANSQAFVNMSSEFLLNLAGDVRLAELWQRGAEYRDLGTAERAQYRALIQWWLNFFENLLYQHKRGLIDDDVYDAWCKDERGFVDRRHLENVWDEVRGNYSDDFILHFDVLVANRRCRLAKQVVESGAVPPCQ